MNYGGNSQDEMEVTIRLDREDRQAHICSTWPEWSRKLDRLYGSPKQVAERDGKVTSAFWIVPLDRVRLRRRPVQRRPLTAEERQAAQERMRRLHKTRSTANSRTD
jgi:hypothetical protein